MGVVAIIPARFASTRLPGKPLSDILGKPMIQHVYERARRTCADRVLVATDDERIRAAAAAFGAEALLTSPDHRTGTDRISEVAATLDAEIIVNVQCDEPLLDPAHVDAAVRALIQHPTVSLATLSTSITSVDEMLDPNAVKVVVSSDRRALYFSRSPIPYVRDADHADPRARAAAAISLGVAERHVGLYVYRREALLRLARLPPAPLETAESLEQLRALHHGMSILVLPIPRLPAPAVDTLDDLERVRALLATAPPGVTEAK